MAVINPYRQLVQSTPRPIQAAKEKAGQFEVKPLQRHASKQDEAVWDANGEFNPYSHGSSRWTDALRPIVNAPERAFDRSGSINAQDKGDALRQISHILETSTRANARFRRRGSTAMPEEQRKIVAAAFHDDEGFACLAQELLLPIKDLIDYESFGRKLLRLRRLSPGELFRITKDVRATAYMIGQDGQGLETKLYGRFVTPSEFLLGGFASINILDLYQGNYDLLDRASDTLRQEIELEEDKRVITTIRAAAQTANTVIGITTLGIGAFEDIRYQVERRRLVAETFVINRAELSDIIKTMSTSVDPVTEREFVLAGFVGSILNCAIVTSAGVGIEQVVPAGEVYCMAGPDFVGEFAIRTELFSEPINHLNQQRFDKGIAAGEICGIAVVNPHGVAMGTK